MKQSRHITEISIIITSASARLKLTSLRKKSGHGYQFGAVQDYFLWKLTNVTDLSLLKTMQRFPSIEWAHKNQILLMSNERARARRLSRFQIFRRQRHGRGFNVIINHQLLCNFAVIVPKYVCRFFLEGEDSMLICCKRILAGLE